MFYRVKMQQYNASFFSFFMVCGLKSLEPIIKHPKGRTLIFATSSPSGTNYALKKNAQDYSRYYNAKVIDTVEIC